MSTCETRVVDPEYAKFLRRTANFALQRPMSESNTLRLEAEMKAGRFVPGTPIYFGVLPDKSLLALNGNHTLDAIVRSERPIELTLIFQDIETVADAAAIYSRFDLHKRRSWRDSLRAYDKESMLGDSTAWTAAFSAALGFLFEKFRVARNDNERELARIQAIQSRDVRVHAMEDAYAAADQYVKAVGEHATDPKLYRRASVMGVAIEIFRYQAAQGAKFFSSLAADDGLRQGDPQRALLRYLREHGAAGAVAREAQARAVALAWNAFFTNRKLEIVKPGAMGEFRIEGTPWTDKEFDPLRAYLPELFLAAKTAEPAAAMDGAADAEPMLLPAEKPAAEKPAKASRRRRIQGGVDHNLQPVAIYDRDPELAQQPAQPEPEDESQEREREPIAAAAAE